MTPSRWVQINDLFNVVVEQAPAEQQRILNGVRARDPDLVDTVEALLQQTAANWSVFPGREKSGELLATLPGGILQERYRLDRQLGQSGFGVVYLAYDERLHQKPVVVKFL